MCVCVSDLDHGGDGMDTPHVLDDALSQVCHAQTDGPVGVTLQLDHLVGTETQSSTLLSYLINSNKTTDSFT